MGRIRKDYSVRSANAPVKGSLAQSRANRDQSMYRGMVCRVYFVDDALNPTKNAQNPQVVYDVILTSGPLEGQIVTNVRSASDIGGQYNYDETIYRPASNPFSGQTRVPLNKQDGDVVFIQFTCGNLSSPVIVGAGAHPLDVSNSGATKADGPRKISEYNGVKTLIDKDGNYSVTRKGGAYDATQGFFKPSDAASNEAQIQLQKNKLIQGVAKNALTTTLDGDADRATTKSKGGLTQTIDGTSDKMTVTTAGGVTLTVDGKSQKITISAGGSTLITVDGSSGKITLAASLVDIGSAASSLAALGTEMMSWLNSHTHMVSGIGAPTAPPIAPAPSSILSGTVKVQS